MAASGSFNTTAYSGRYLTFAWTETSQSIEKNQTTISWTLKGAGGDSTWYMAGAFKLVIDSKTVYSSATRIQLGNGTTVASGTYTFTHGSDGSKKFTASAEAGIYTYAVNCTGSGTFTLDTIPRKSSLTVSNGTLGTAQTLTITEKASAFKHKIEYNCGSLAGYVAGSASSFETSNSISWTPPLSFATQNTTGTSVSVKLTLYTYTSDGTNIGYEQKTITCAIPASVKPSCTFTLDDTTGIDDTYGSPVQGLSKIKYKVTATTAQGSPIASYAVSIDGTNYTKAEATTGALKKAGDSVVTVTVKDKRGRTGTASYTMKVQAYTAPNVSKLTVHRCDADGTNNDQGGYIRVVFSAAVTSLSSKNTAAYKLQYKKTSASSYTTKNFTELANVYTVTDQEFIFAADATSSYDVVVTATDRHKATPRATTASTAFSLIDFHPEGNGLRFGGVAEEENTLQNDLHLRQIGNRYAFSTPGVANTGGFILMAHITITAANADTPITFIFSQRQQPTTMKVTVCFRNSTMDASTVQVSYEGTNYNAYVSKADELNYGLYVYKSSNWDTITLQDWYTSKTMQDRIAVTFPGTAVAQVPTPYYKATPAQLRSLLDYIYPVDSVYISYSHKDPAEMFGGTWVRITEAFLWATTAGGTIGQTGGSKTHTLTVNELPSHAHAIDVTNTASGSVTVSEDMVKYNKTATTFQGSIATANQGGGAAHNNMPPYIQVSVWRRTA